MKISGKICVCKSLVQLQDKLEPIELWKDAYNENDYRRSFETFLFQMRNNHGAIEETTCEFGVDFLQSATDLGFLQNDTRARALLRACGETVTNLNLSATHALRKGRGASEQQIVRNGKKAYRRDIDHEFHLHYWHSSTGVEFASVVVHKNMTIPDPR